MKAIQVVEVGSFIITNLTRPSPGPGEALIRVEVTGLCRTDLKLIRVGHRDLTLPRVPAEEVVGIVEEIGDGVESVAVADRVYVYPGVWCGQCPACMKGAENLCREMRIMGFHRDGGFAEYVLAPAQSLIKVPEGLAPEEAVFAEPLSCCLNALEMARVGPGDLVGIWGAGPAGSLLARAAKALGAKPMNTDPDPERRKRINGFGTFPEELSFDAAFAAVGDRSAYEEALEKLGPRGRLVSFSGLPPSGDRISVSFNQLHYLEQTIVGAYGCSFRHGVQALEMIASGLVPVKELISHKMPLWELGKALDLVAEKKGMKILLYP